jgi:hypothetical protein
MRGPERMQGAHLKLIRVLAEKDLRFAPTPLAKYPDLESLRTLIELYML